MLLWAFTVPDAPIDCSPVQTDLIHSGACAQGPQIPEGEDEEDYDEEEEEDDEDESDDDEEDVGVSGGGPFDVSLGWFLEAA